MTASKIEWTDRSDWNPIRGCTRVSRGCGGPGKAGGCYAERIAARFSDPGQPFEGFARRVNGEARWTGKVELIGDRLLAPLHWRKPARIFACSMSDLFHEALPDAAIDQVFAVMALCPQHTFQVLTKRAERMRDYLKARDGMGNAALCQAINEIPAQLGNRRGALVMPLPNVWLGVSTEDQTAADERIPALLDTPAAKRFISAEPLLGPIDLARAPYGDGSHGVSWLTGEPFLIDGAAAAPRPHDRASLDWVIAGGESGPGARVFDVAWARSIIAQCATAGVPVLMKQVGSRPIIVAPGDGWPGLLRDRKGGDPSEWPADIRIREFPVSEQP